MASSEQVKALLSSYIEGDDSRFFATAMQVAASEAKQGHSKVASEIRALIDKARSTQTLLPAQREPTPLARPSKELSDLLHVSYPKVRLVDMTLDNELEPRLHRILEEQSQIEILKANGLNPRRKLLFTGPPGCGKTMSASVIAGELGIPLFVVRLDGLITKFMGESIVKLRLIFDSIKNTRAVYLFDEFDSIGSQRSFTNDVGEIKRVLNSFLMYIEQDVSNSIIIAATNHAQNLDFALFRRFDELLEFKLPGKDLIAKFIEWELSRFKPENLSYMELSEDAQGLSFADIEIACEEAIKTAILRSKSIETDDVKTPILERAAFHNRYKE